MDAWHSENMRKRRWAFDFKIVSKDDIFSGRKL